MIYADKPGYEVITKDKTTAEVNEAIKEHDHIIMLGHGTPQGLLSVGKFNKPAPKKIVASAKPTAGVKSYSTYGAKTAAAGYDMWGDDDYLPGFDDVVYPKRAAGFVQTHPPTETYQGYTTGYIVNEDTVDLLKGKRLTSIWCNADQFVEWNKLGGFYTGMFISEVGEAQIIGLKHTDKWQVEESNYGFVEAARKHIDKEPKEMLAAIKDDYGKLIDHNEVVKYNYRRLYAR